MVGLVLVSVDVVSVAVVRAPGNVDPARYERAAIRWLQRYIDERLPPLAEVALEIRQMLLDSVGQAEVG